MSVRYRSYSRRIVTEYRCSGAHMQGGPVCQAVIGTGIDAVVGALLVEAMTPSGRRGCSRCRAGD
jgi:hypothetical protein